MTEHLQGCGVAVLQAASASEAVETLERVPDVDLVFTDLRLPGARDGIALARWIAKKLPGIPVMVTSGELGSVRELSELCRAEGFTSFGKPYAHAEVSARILELIEARRHRGAP